MKKFLLSLMGVAMLGSYAFADTVEVDFMGSDPMYGMERQTKNPGLIATGITYQTELSFTENGVDFSFTKDQNNNPKLGFGLINNSATSQGLAMGAYYAGKWKPIITLTVPGGKITKSVITYTKMVTMNMTANGALIASDEATPSTYTWKDAAGVEELVWSYENDLSGMQYIAKISVEYERGATGKENPNLSFNEDSANYLLGKDNTLPVLNNPDNLPIVWSSSNDAIATVDAEGNVTVLKAGTVKINAEFAGNDAYNDLKLSYTLNVLAVAANISEMFTMAPENANEVYVDFPMYVTDYSAQSGNEYVVDAEGNGALVTAFQINENGGDTEVKPIGYSTGSVIPAGWVATRKNEAQTTWTNWTGYPQPSTETVSLTYPEVTSLSVDDIYKMVVLKNVTFTEESLKENIKEEYYGTLADGTNVTFSNKRLGSIPGPGTYDVKGIYQYATKNGNVFANFFMPVSATKVEVVEPVGPEFPESFDVTADIEGVVIDQYIDEDTDAYTIEVTGETEADEITLNFNLPEGWDALVGTQMSFHGWGVKKLANAAEWVGLDEYKEEMGAGVEEGTSFTFKTGDNIFGNYVLVAGDQVDVANPIAIVVHVDKKEIPAPVVGDPCKVTVKSGSVATTQTAKVGDEFTINFDLDEYWTLATLEVNGEDAFDAEGYEENQLSLALAGDTEINAVAEFNGEVKEIPTGVSELENGVKIEVSDDAIEILNANGQELCIYSVGGEIIKKMNIASDDVKIQLTKYVVYIVRVGSQAVKVIL